MFELLDVLLEENVSADKVEAFLLANPNIFTICPTRNSSLLNAVIKKDRADLL